jgi:GNAT superfamily N-acetyltransferase
MNQLTVFTQSLWRRWMKWVPVRILSPKHRPRISAHLKSLAPQDRYLRFGYPLLTSKLKNYVNKLNFARDDIYGVFNRRLEIVSMAHLAFSVDPEWATCAEFGVSVDLRMRGKGLGARLFDRAVMRARNEGVGLLFIHALSENPPCSKLPGNLVPEWCVMAAKVMPT